MKELTQQHRDMLLNSIRNIPDFPKPGIQFKDITTLLNNKQAYRLLMNHFSERYKGYGLDIVAGIESRGFIFGAALADRLGVGFVPIRKKGKLPYTTISEKYSLEYGYDEVEVHIDAFLDEGANVLLIDDLLATGGTAEASAKLIKQAKANCVECCFLMELEFLSGKEKLRGLSEIYSVLKI